MIAITLESEWAHGDGPWPAAMIQSVTWSPPLMSFLSLFGSLLHYPHQPTVEEEGHVISRRLRELLEEGGSAPRLALSIEHQPLSEDPVPVRDKE